MTKIKICGLRTAANALMVAQAGADLIGLNFYPPSPRAVDVALGCEIARALREEFGAARPTLVGVFVNATADEVRDIVEEVGLDFAQLSGDEEPETLEQLAGVAFKAIRPVDEADALRQVECFAGLGPQSADAPSILLDAFNPKLYGGTGEMASLRLSRLVKEMAPRLMLAGGLNPDNVADRARAIGPWGVDVASGVEAGLPGIKDEDKVRAFIAAARAVDA